MSTLTRHVATCRCAWRSGQSPEASAATDETNGELFEQRVEFAPGSPFPPTHYHPQQSVRFEVEQGAMIYVVDGSEQRLETGQALELAAGVPHRARNASADEPALVRWETRPELRSEAFFRTAAAVDGDGLLASARLAHEYRDVFRATGVTGVMVPLVALLARLLDRTLPKPFGDDVKET